MGNNAIFWDDKIQNRENLKSLSTLKNSIPNRWVYGILAMNKLETIKKYREQGYYATSVHLNNNLYSVFENKTELKGVDEFMNSFIALPCGWWFNTNNINEN